MNAKLIGERAEAAVIGELAKWGIDVALPMTDNCPFDFITITEPLKRVQVKSSSQRANGSAQFSLRTTNWYRGTQTKSSSKNCDIVILYDLCYHFCYLLLPKDFDGRGHFSIRGKKTKYAGHHLHDDYILSTERIKQAFGIEREFGFPIAEVKEIVKIAKTCDRCNKQFETIWNKTKYCSPICSQFAQRRCERPDRNTLAKLLSKKSWLAIAREFNVSDNAVRKWARQYEII